MKSSYFIASIKPNSNKLISDSNNTDWSSLRRGNTIKFIGDDIFYTIGSVSPFTYVKNFEILDQKRLKIYENISNNIARGDQITISYKQSELSELLSIQDGGLNYKVDDIIYPISGIPVKNSEDNLENKIQFVVKEVSNLGEILQVGILNKGLYLELPEEECVMAGGAGEGAILELEYKESSGRVKLQRNIFSTTIGEESIIFLDYPINNGVRRGSISINKWEIILTSLYCGAEKINEKFEISRDFTPHLNLPLLLKGSLSVETNYNQAMRVLDNKIKILEEKLDSLLNNKLDGN